ncbi:unnamed protein product [Allacma fusca]|uniref:Uncharacterized protein n=1 Tax=Allacma fusca TaxID=39272 RepID=A0A8J2K040_9HEXA|nr:unnamed protein product [Allacma fusca]
MALGKPWLSDNGLRAEKRTCRSISLSWNPDTLDIPLGHSTSEDNFNFSTDDYLSDDNTESLDETNKPWFEVQMKVANGDSWTTVYKGYNKKCEVKDLNPDTNVNFRLRSEIDAVWGSIILAATDASPPNAEDLHRAVHCNAEEMVLRIIGASRTAHVKKLLASHDRSGLSPLMIAAQNGNSNVLSILLQSGAQVNAKSLSTIKTPLMFAAFHGHLSVVQILDRAGAEWDCCDKTGCNVLHHAVNGGNLRIVLYILDRTGKRLLNEKDYSGWTPLMRSIVVGRSTEVVKLLLLRGADPNATDKVNTKSCLMAAALLGKHEMVTQLLLANADPSYINANDKSIVDISDNFGSEGIKNQICEAINSSTGLLREELKKSRKFQHLLESKDPVEAPLCRIVIVRAELTSK